MQSEAAEQLRQSWKEAGNPPCRHSLVELESVTDQYFTGRHACTTCGAILEMKPQCQDR